MNIFDFLLVPLSGWLNRVRGGGLGGEYLPGVNDIWVFPFYVFAAWMSGLQISPTFAWILSFIVPHLSPWIVLYGVAFAPILVAILFGLCWLIEMTPAWGKLFRLWFMEPVDRPGSWYERLFLKLTGGNYTLAFGLRMTVFAIPLAFFFGWLWLLIGPAALLAYIAGWSLGSLIHKLKKATPEEPIYGIFYSEIIFGVVWAIFILLGKYGVLFI